VLVIANKMKASLFQKKKKKEKKKEKKEKKKPVEKFPSRDRLTTQHVPSSTVLSFSRWISVS
jgi:hypothetical protein